MVKIENDISFIKEKNNKNSIEEILKHIRKQIVDLHFWENEIDIKEKNLKHSILTKMEKQLEKHLFKLKLKKLFLKWVTEPLWWAKKTA